MTFKQRNNNRYRFSMGQIERMKRLAVLVTLLLTMAGLLLSGISDVNASVTNTSLPDNEVASTVNETGNSDSANATITIIMRTVPLPEE